MALESNEIKKIKLNPKQTLVVRTELIMPVDANMLNKLMGGNILRWMDIAASVSAQKFSGCPCVTVAVNYVSFNYSADIGDIITMEAKLTRSFNTSMEVYIKVYTGKKSDFYGITSNEAFFTFVAIDEQKKPTLVPTLVPETEIEKKMYEDALLRRELHLLFSKNKKIDELPSLKNKFS